MKAVPYSRIAEITILGVSPRGTDHMCSLSSIALDN